LPQLIDKGASVPKDILIEEFHVSVFVPRELSEPEFNAARRTLDSSRFHIRVKRTVCALMRKYRSLRRAKITLTR
jgi:hypothetical protein